jgi:hypothetical protein
MGRGGGLADLSCDNFIFVISLVKVNYSFCQTGGEEMTPNVTYGNGGRKSKEIVSHII